MNKLALIAVSAALSIAAAASSRTADAASLRTDTMISGATVRLGDLFDDVMGKEDQPVGRAPAPGRRATYDATYLTRIASYHQVSWKPGSQFERAVVTRTSSVVNAAMVRNAVEAELATKANADRLDVDLDNKLLEVHLPADQPTTLKLESVTFDQVQGRFTAVLVTPAEGQEQTRTAITGRAAALIEVPVLTRRVKPGEV